MTEPSGKDEALAPLLAGPGSQATSIAGVRPPGSNPIVRHRTHSVWGYAEDRAVEWCGDRRFQCRQEP
jgi:hypothetical protein